MLLIGTTSATISITLDIEPSFGIGEEVSFDYSITSDTTIDIEYIASATCPNIPAPLLEIKNATLTANVPLIGNYTYMSSIAEGIELQNCKAIVGVINPETSEEKSFEIKANPSLQLDLFSCKDQSCSEKVNVFIKGENIFLDYNSDISDFNIESTLISPNGAEQQITIPTSIKAEQIGTYRLDASASKDGYQTITKSLQFAVIEKEANIEYTPVEKISSLADTNFVTWIFSKINNMDIVSLVSWGILIIGGIVILVILIIIIVQKIKTKQF